MYFNGIYCNQFMHEYGMVWSFQLIPPDLANWKKGRPFAGMAVIPKRDFHPCDYFIILKGPLSLLAETGNLKPNFPQHRVTPRKRGFVFCLFAQFTYRWLPKKGEPRAPCACSGPRAPKARWEARTPGAGCSPRSSPELLVPIFGGSDPCPVCNRRKKSSVQRLPCF